MNVDEAEALAERLMKKHGLPEQGWKFRWDHRSTRRFGGCARQRKLILLSMPMVRVNDLQQVKDVILHEIAHALAGRSGNRAHSKAFYDTCRKIGARPERCYSYTTVLPMQPEGRKVAGIKSKITRLNRYVKYHLQEQQALVRALAEYRQEGKLPWWLKSYGEVAAKFPAAFIEESFLEQQRRNTETVKSLQEQIKELQGKVA